MYSHPREKTSMNKLSIFAIIATIAIPVMADETPKTDTTTETESIAAQYGTNDTDISAQLTQIQEQLTQMQSDISAQRETLMAQQTPNAPETQDDNVTYSVKSNSEIHFPHGMQSGVGLSATSGLNGFVGYANKKFDSFWWKRVGIRFDFATTKPLKSMINRVIDNAMGDDGVDIGDNLTINDGALKAHHFAAMVDIYPFGDTWFLGGWRVSGGYYMGKMDLSANLAGHVDGVPGAATEFKLMDTTYRYNGGDITGTAHAKWNFHGPYVDTGFDLGLFAGIKIYMDAGVVFTNRAAELSLDVPLTDKLQVWDGTTWQNVDNPTLQSAFDDAKCDALADANDELNDYKFYPMIKIGLMYRF